jgi:hypothetical protein
MKAPTVTAATCTSINTTDDRQVTDVEELHDDVPQVPLAKLLLLVCCPVPKLSPTTVTEEPPLGAALEKAKEMDGASKLSTGCPVPATAPTVTALYPNMCLVLLCRHATDVDELHDEVLHTPASTPALAVCSPTPKFRPDTVTVCVPEVGPFARMLETGPASNVRIFCAVPDVAVIVTCAYPGYPKSASATQLTDEDEVHEAVEQMPTLNALVKVWSAVPKLKPVTVT